LKSRIPLSGTLRVLLAASMLSISLVAPSAGQDAAPAADAATATKAPQGVSPDQIPARASSARVTLEAVRSRLARPVSDSRDKLAAMAAVIDRLDAKTDTSRLEQVPEFRIAELGRQVEFYRRELANAESLNVARAMRLSADAAELNRMRGVWTATLVAAERDQLSRALIDEVRAVLREIEQTEALLEQPLSRTLTGRQRASGYENHLDAMMRTLKDADAQAKARRLSRDVPPLWAPGELQISADKDWDAVRNRINDQVAFSRDFFAAKHDKLEAYVLVAVLSLVAALWLRRKGELFATAGEPPPDASRVLKRPFSSLLLILLVAALLTVEMAPTIVLEALAMAIMLVLLRLMPSRLMAGRRILLVGLVLLFILDRARNMLPFSSLAFRADQLLVAIGLAAGFVHVLWLKRAGELPPRSWLTLLARVAPIALGLLLVAIAANVAGNISLADLLIRGTLTSTYVSAILFAAAFIVDDFVQMMVRSKVGQKLHMVTLHGEEIAQGTRKVARFIALLAWINISVGAFQLWVPLANWLKQVLEISWQFGEVSFTLGGVATFVIGVLAAVYSSRLVRFLLNEEVLSRVSWPPGAKSTTATLAYYGVLFAGLLLALSAAGIETSQFALVVGALGVGIGFGLQNVVNNFVSGLILMFERPIQPGDIIDVDTLQGRVIEIGLRATRVKTWEGAEVIVPNGSMLSSNLINWTLSDTSRRVEIPVGVAYGTSIRRVLDLLMKVAQAQADAMTDPPPMVLFTGFGDSSLDFSVRFWTRDATTAVTARSEAGAAISEALEAEGIEIPFPQRDLHLRSVDAGVAAAVGRPTPAAGGTATRDTPSVAGNVDSLGPPAQGADDTDGPSR
jgi:potassium efflux system protein